MFIFNNVSKVFKPDFYAQGFWALKNVSFEVKKGAMVGFLGANGAGKTTSLKILMDFIRASSGSVEFSKELGVTRSDIFKQIGFLPERPYFYPHLKGSEFLEFMGRLSGMNKNEIQDQVKRWAPRFKIDHALNRELKTYSKGMLQRTGFLATILHDPMAIVLDEPLSGLDPIGRKELKDVMVEVHRAGKTVFFSSHIVPDIEAICDDVIFLKDGELAYQGSVEKLLSSHKKNLSVFRLKDASLNFQTKTMDVKKLAEDIVEISVMDNDKDNFLKEILDKKINLISMEIVRPSLEEIFYQTRGQ